VALGMVIYHRFVVSALKRAVEQQADLAHGAYTTLAAATLAWVWTSVLLVIVVDLIFTKLCDKLSTEQSQAQAETLRNIQTLVRTRDAVIFGLANLAESRDEMTGRHVERVSFYSGRLAIAAGVEPKFRDVVTPEFVRVIAVSSVLHDIGKVGIEDRILFKPGALSEAERLRMHQHTTLGAKYLADIEQRLGSSQMIRMARDIALWHHEHWDGTGYPHGLAGEAIPLPARIVGIADVYEALMSLRVYKPPYCHERCVEIIRGEAGKQFDPDLVAAFLRVQSSFRRFADQYGEDSFRSYDRQVQPSTNEDVRCMGLAPAMKAIDEEWTVPAGGDV